MLKNPYFYLRFATINSLTQFKDMRLSIQNLFSAIATVVIATACSAQTTISLPKPNKTLKTTLISALENRHSERNFSERAFSDQNLATLLWAANGVNRPNGRRTAPSAMDRRDIDIYVIRADGAYLWNPDDNTLQQRSTKDLRKAVAGRQDIIAKAPVALVLVSDGAKFGDRPNNFGLADAGYVSQNICLICSAAGWATCPRASMDSETLSKELGLTKQQVPLLNNPVGYPKEK